MRTIAFFLTMFVGGCGFVDCVEKEFFDTGISEECETYYGTSAAADTCPDELGGEWNSGSTASGTFSDRTGAARCEVTDLVVYVDFAGLGDYGHVLGAFGMTGNVSVYEASSGSPVDTYTIQERVNYPNYMAAVGDLRVTGSLSLEIYSGYSPDPVTGANGVHQATLTGQYDASSDTIFDVKLSADPTNNGSVDSHGCYTFSMPSSFTLYRTSTNTALVASEYAVVSNSESEQLVECEDTSGGTSGDTGTTEAYTGEDVIDEIGPRPSWRVDRDGRFPTSAYTAALGLWNVMQPLQTVDIQTWGVAMHGTWDGLFMAPQVGGVIPISNYWLPGAPNTPLDRQQVKWRGHSIIEWLKVESEQREAINLVVQRYGAGTYSEGDLEWYVGSVLSGSPAQPPPPPPPQ